jgi:hypothetical protein
VVLLLGACVSRATWDSEHVEVRFTDRSIEPASAHVAKTGRVRWVNSGTEILGRVVLPASIVSSLTCDDLGPAFRPAEGGYVSLPIEVMGSHLLPCPLAPGSYDYEILIFGAGLGSGPTPSVPQNRLRGALVVQ